LFGWTGGGSWSFGWEVKIPEKIIIRDSKKMTKLQKNKAKEL